MGFVQECKNCLTFEKSLSVIYHSHRLKKKKKDYLKRYQNKSDKFQYIYDKNQQPTINRKTYFQADK